MMHLVAFKDCFKEFSSGPTEVSSTRAVRLLQADTKAFSSLIQDLLFVHDCALVAHNQDSAEQLLFDQVLLLRHVLLSW